MGVAIIPLRITAFALATLLFTACASPQDAADRHLLDTLKMDLASQYHECLPLGWAPVRVLKSYYPGRSIGLQNYAEWLDAMWIGSVHNDEMHRPDVAIILNVLDRLVGKGLLVRRPSPNGRRYYMTFEASHYFYEANLYRNNPDRVRYLCYSTVVPVKIVSKGAEHLERYGRRMHRVFTVTFEWKASAPAAWANDPYLRAHSVILAPIQSPATGAMMYVNGDWDMASLDKDESPLPALTDPSAWPSFSQAMR